MKEEKIAPAGKATKRISIKKITENAKFELKELTGFIASSVISIKQDQGVWKVLVELLEKKGIPDRMDILGLYEAQVDSSGNLTGYERKSLRKRGDTGIQESEEVDE